MGVPSIHRHRYVPMKKIQVKERFTVFPANMGQLFAVKNKKKQKKEKERNEQKENRNFCIQFINIQHLLRGVLAKFVHFILVFVVF